tara:strand:+ start:1870 stop:2481 length:612 start_codon:yes stop_codon:yes gene_type:complete
MSNANLKLLTEWTPLSYTTAMISESRGMHQGKIMLKGVLQRSETLNQNGRIYPKAILERELLNYQKFIKESRALGECDHPDSSVVELKNASHIIREAHMDGDAVVGTIELLNTPAGQILQSLVESGVTLGISSRGVGSTMKEGNAQIVQEDFQLICFDMVSEPSTPGAFMLKESRGISQEELNKHFKTTDKINRIFNEIIGWE